MCNAAPDETPVIECISAVTLHTRDMARAVRFYRSVGFELLYGGEGAAFSSFAAGRGYLNLMVQTSNDPRSAWGRVIFHVSDVDAMYATVIGLGMRPDTAPADAEWGERYFHLTDPDGHSLSFARPLGRPVAPNRP